MEKKYDELAKEILSVLGDKDNISFFSHCATRLRASVKDRGLLKEDEIRKIKGVIDYRWTGDQIQIIIGTHVNDVYDEICDIAGFEKQKPVDECFSDDLQDKSDESKSFNFYYIVELISSALIPSLAVFVGAGMIKVLLIFLNLLNLLPEDGSTYQILFNASDSIYYFMPLFIGYGVAKKMNSELTVGLAMGAILVAPTFIANVNENIPMDFMGISIYLKAYNGTFLPAILSTSVACILYDFLEKRIPIIVRQLIAPLITLLIMIPLTYIVLGPIASIIGDYLAAAVMWIYGMTGFVGIAFFGVILPLLITTGMHYCFSPYWAAMVTTPGGEVFYLISNCIYNINAGVACIIMSLKTKSLENKSLFTSTGISSMIAGVSEPALFGVLLKNRRALYSVMIGNAIGCGVAGILHISAHMWPPSWGVFMIPAFINTGSDLFYCLIAIALGIISTAIMTFILYRGKEVE